MKKILLILCALVCGTLAFAQTDGTYTGNLHVEVSGSESDVKDSQVTVEWDTDNKSQLDFTLHDFAISIGSVSLDLGDITIKEVDVDTANEKDGVATISCTDDHDVTLDSSLSSLVSDISVAMTGEISDDKLYAEMSISVSVLILGDYNITATFRSYSDDELNGDYLIMNTETGQFLYGSYDWGSRASLGSKPVFFTVTSTGENTYTLSSQQWTDTKYLYLSGTAFYCDTSTSTNITVTETETGSGIYTISYNGSYMLQSGKNAGTTTTTDASQASHWQFVSMDDVVASMANASSANPVDVTALINDANFKPNGNGLTAKNNWTSSGVTIGKYESNATTACCAEGYNEESFSVKQTITLPKAGYYNLSAQGFYRNGSDGTGSNAVSAQMYIGNETVDLDARRTTANSMADAWAVFLEGSEPVTSITYYAESDEEEVEIGFTGAVPNASWAIFGELELEYLGETLEYAIGEPECTTAYVQPGGELTITFPNCVTPNTNDEPVLDSSKSITVNGENVTDVVLTSTGLTSTVTFTVPTSLDQGAEVTVIVPAGLIYWEVEDGENVLSPAGEFTLSTPSMADQYGVYLYNTHANQFLSRGGESSDVLSTWGELAATDVYGIPLDITFGNDGFATIKFLDSQLYLYGGGWAWTDAVEANAGKYAVKELTVDGETVYQFCYEDLDDTYLYVNDESHNYVASNGNLNGDNNLQSDITRTYWQIYSVDERNDHKAARELNDHIAIAEAAGAIVTTEEAFQSYLEGLTETDVTSKVADAALAGSISGWTEEDYVGNFSSDTNGTEIYQGDADLAQTVSGLDAGIYKVTLQGLVRQGGYANIIDNNLGIYDLSIGFLEANGYQTNIMPWAEDREKVTGVTLTDSYPNSMAEASNCFSQGLYVNELYTYVGEDGTLEISINCPDALSGGWMIVKNLTLTQYIGETVAWEMTTANWGTLVLPFDADVPDGLTVYTCDGTETNEETGTTTVTVTEVTTGIAANTPYLVKGNVEEDTYYTFSGTSEEATGDLTKGLLVGTLVDMSLDGGDFTADSGQYVLQNHEDEGVAFYPITGESSGVTLSAYHCYLTLQNSGDAQNPVRAFISLPDSDDVTTAIKTVEGDVIANDAIYDLSGRRVSKAVKGVYIQNGKKVLVK